MVGSVVEVDVRKEASKLRNVVQPYDFRERQQCVTGELTLPLTNRFTLKRHLPEVRQRHGASVVVHLVHGYRNGRVVTLLRW